MSDPLLEKAIADAAFFDGLEPGIVNRVAAGASWRRYAPGSVIFHEGRHSDAFYVVHQGHVALDMNIPARGAVRLLTIGPGEMLAWSAIVSDRRMSATATATDHVELIMFSGSQLREWCETDAHFGYQWMSRIAAALAKRLVSTRLQMLDLFAPDAAAAEGAAP